MSSQLEYLIVALLGLIAVNLTYAVLRFSSFLAEFRKRGFPPSWEYQPSSLGFDYPLLDIVDRVQQETGVVLTWGGRQMLITPVVETLQREGRVDWDEVYRSVREILMAIAEDQSQRPSDATRNSISVIRGFHKRFCNIPPFCSRTER